MDSLWRQINEAIHRRDTAFVARTIPKYLRAHHSSPEAIYEASEFYRKITDYASALRVLPKEPLATRSSKRSDIETKLELQQARILNALGASNYALRMVERIVRENRARSKVEILEIYHCNCRYREVNSLLGPRLRVPESEPWHQDWLLHFYYALALNGIGRRKAAIDHVDKIAARSESPLIQAMAIGYRGQFLVENNHPEEALPHLLDAQRFFRAEDQTSDHAILQKWLGICYLKLGKYPEAERALEIARRIFYQPGLKPEDWMEVVLWQDRVPLTSPARSPLAPRLSALAGPALDALAETGTPASETERTLFSVNRIVRSRKQRHIDRASEMVWSGTKAELGLDLVDELLWTLIYAGKHGLPQFRLYETLWPKEPFSFDQHQKRLEQLIMRARKRGYAITWKGLHLYLRSRDVSTSGRPLKTIRGGSFLSVHPTFLRSDVQRYFSISQSSAASLCREWLQAKRVRRLTSSRYEVLLRES